MAKTQAEAAPAGVKLYYSAPGAKDGLPWAVEVDGEERLASHVWVEAHGHTRFDGRRYVIEFDEGAEVGWVMSVATIRRSR